MISPVFSSLSPLTGSGALAEAASSAAVPPSSSYEASPQSLAGLLKAAHDAVVFHWLEPAGFLQTLAATTASNLPAYLALGDALFGALFCLFEGGNGLMAGMVKGPGGRDDNTADEDDYEEIAVVSEEAPQEVPPDKTLRTLIAEMARAGELPEPLPPPPSGLPDFEPLAVSAKAGNLKDLYRLRDHAAQGEFMAIAWLAEVAEEGNTHAVDAMRDVLDKGCEEAKRLVLGQMEDLDVKRFLKSVKYDEDPNSLPVMAVVGALKTLIGRAGNEAAASALAELARINQRALIALRDLAHKNIPCAVRAFASLK